MRILILNNQSRITGGADRHCFDLADELRGAGHRVEFLATDSPERIEPGAFVPLGVSNSTRDSLALEAQARVAAHAIWNRTARAATEVAFDRFAPDVVHSHKLYPHLSVAPIVVATKQRIPIVQTVHDYEFISANPSDVTGGPIDRTESRFAYRALNSALFQIKRRVHVPAVSSWVAVSRAVGETYSAHGIPSTAIPNFTRFTDGSRLSHEQRSGIIFAGRLSSEKGIGDVLTVAAQLPDIEVRIAGGGPLEDEVAAAAVKHENLKLLGHLPQDELSQELSRSLICLMPSRWEEPGPLASLEAMAAGTPIVSFDVGGLGEYVKDAGAGRTVPLYGGSMFSACRDILSDAGTWTEFSENGRRAAETTHSASRYIDAILEVYEGAIRRSA